MATFTPNLGLKQPAINENVSLEDYNMNLELIDDQFQYGFVVGKRQGKEITGSQSAQTVRINLPVGYWFMILSVPTVNKTWVGIVICASNGNVDIEQINSGTGLTITPGTNRIDVSFIVPNDTTLQMTDIPFRSNNHPSFN